MDLLLSIYCHIYILLFSGTTLHNKSYKKITSMMCVWHIRLYISFSPKIIRDKCDKMSTVLLSWTALPISIGERFLHYTCYQLYAQDKRTFANEFECIYIVKFLKCHFTYSKHFKDNDLYFILALLPQYHFISNKMSNRQTGTHRGFLRDHCVAGNLYGSAVYIRRRQIKNTRSYAIIR